MSELSRVEDLLKTGVEEPVLPMSRLEAILRGEKITPMSRVEELLLQYNPSDILIEKRITANGTYFAVNDNADGYFKVVVDTPVTPSVVLDHLVETITENGTYTYTPEHDGFEDAEITVNVSGGGSSILGYGSGTSDGLYRASNYSKEITKSVTPPSIEVDSYAHINIDEIGDVTQIPISVRYTGSSRDKSYTIDISNIPTYTPSGSSFFNNMYEFDSYNSSQGAYISKDATGIWLGREGGMTDIYAVGYTYEVALDGFSKFEIHTGSPAKNHTLIYPRFANDDSGGSRSYSLREFRYIDFINGSEHIVKDLLTLYFTGTSHYSTDTSTSISNNNTLNISWSTQSGSTRQTMDIYYIDDLSLLKTLSSTTKYTDNLDHEFTLPDEAKNLPIDHFFVDFSSVESGGASNDVVVKKEIVDGKLVVNFGLNGGYTSVDARILYTLYKGDSSNDSHVQYLGYGEQTATDANWTEGILPIDTINKASNFDDYLEYDATTKYFTCKLDFDALIVFWVYNLHSSDNRPQVLLSDSNNSTIETISTNSTSAGAKGGSGIIVRMSAGYSFKFINPEPKGWGFVRAKFYKVDNTTVYDFNEP